MRLKGVCFLIFLMALAALAPASASTRTATRDYVGFSALIHGCGQGAVCFQLDGTEATVDLSIDDEFASHVQGRYSFRQQGSSNVLGEGDFCGGASQIAVPAGATVLHVQVMLDGCTSLTNPPVKGTITAEFA